MLRKLCSAAFIALLAMPLLASTHTWTGAASGLLSDPANWIGGSPAGDAAADLVFPSGATNRNPVNDLASLTVHSITFSAGSYVLSGNALAITATLDTQNIGNTYTPVTISCDLHITSLLTVIGSRFTNGGVLTLSGAISGDGSLSVTGRVTLAGSSPNTYTGETIAGTGLIAAKDPGVYAIPGAVTVNGENNDPGLTIMTSQTIPPDANVNVVGMLALKAGTTTALNHVSISGSTQRGFIPGIGGTGTLLLGDDLAVHSYATIYPFLPLPSTRTFDLGLGTSLSLGNVDGAPGAGIVVKSGEVTARGKIDGTCSAACPRCRLFLHSPAASLTLSDGATGGGDVKSVLVQGATLQLGYGGETYGDITLDAASTVLQNLLTQASIVTGTISLGGAALNMSPVRVPGAQYTVFDNRGSGPVVGTFGGIPEGGTTSDGHFRITYRGGDGNDVVATDLWRIPTTTELLQPTVGASGATITLKATVRSTDFVSYPAPLPDGTVTFLDGGSPMGTATMGSNGSGATLTVPYLAGKHVVTAAYSGDATYEPSVSAAGGWYLPYPEPAVTSVDPNHVQAGTSVTLHLTGKNFEPTLKAVVLAPVRATAHYLSETEATVDFDATDVKTASPQWVVQLANQYSLSTSLTVVITAPAGQQTLEVRVPDAAYEGARQTVSFTRTGDSSATLTAQWTLTAGKNAVAGRDYAAATGSVTFVSGQTLATFDVQTLDDQLYEGQRTLKVDVTSSANVTYSRGQLLYINENEPKPVAGFDGNDLVIAEGNDPNATVTLTVRLSTSAAIPIELSYGVTKGSVGTHGTVTIPAGATTVPLALKYGANTLPELDRQLMVDLDGNSDLTLDLASRRRLITIMDDDVPRVSFESAAINVQEGSGTTFVSTNVFLDNSPPRSAVTVEWTTVDGTAKAGVDYVAASGTLTFPLDRNSQPLKVQVLGNSTAQPSRVFAIALRNATNATINRDSTAITIVDDDGGSLGIQDSAVVEGLPGTTTVMTFTVSLDRALTTPVTVDYATADGSATAPDDYVPAQGTLTFATGETSKTISILVHGDSLFESSETLFVNLSKPSGASIQRGTASGTILNDDVRRRAAGH